MQERAERTGRFSFAHALINHTLYDDLGRDPAGAAPPAGGRGARGPLRRRPGPAHRGAGAPLVGGHRAGGRGEGAGLQQAGGRAGARRAGARRGGAVVHPGARAARAGARSPTGRALRPDDRPRRGAAPGRQAEFRETLLGAGRIAEELGDAGPHVARRARQQPRLRERVRRRGRGARGGARACDRAGRATRLAAPAARRSRRWSSSSTPTTSAGVRWRTRRSRWPARRATSACCPTCCATTSTPPGRADTLRCPPPHRQGDDGAGRAAGRSAGRHLGAGPVDPRRGRVRGPARGQRGVALLLARTEQVGQPRLRWPATYYAAGLAQMRGELRRPSGWPSAALELGEQAGEPDTAAHQPGAHRPHPQPSRAGARR